MHWPFIWSNYSTGKQLMYDLERWFPDAKVNLRLRGKKLNKRIKLTITGQYVEQAYSHQQFISQSHEMPN